MSAHKDLSYPNDFVDRIEISWGDGFLSPGGPDEVREVLRDTEVASKTVLDIGCGTAGPALVMVGELGAARVVGVDIEAQVIERGINNVRRAGLDECVALQLVQPGPLPFASGTFDVVFSKDSLIHIDDKAAVFTDVLRVLKPGGVFAASDWLAGENAAQSEEFQRWLDTSTHHFVMQTAREAMASMRAAGFEAVASRDRNAWYAAVATREVALMEGPLRQRFLDAGGEARYQQLLTIRKTNADAVRCGSLRPTHLRGRKRI
ncbi:MAG: methyltransferase domain-containing protein [Gammaproteobacteria bacterium]|nr:methyltransferase domain-containing protein [Gammaproteobacteria bacterium]